MYRITETENNYSNFLRDIQFTEIEIETLKEIKKEAYISLTKDSGNIKPSLNESYNKLCDVCDRQIEKISKIKEKIYDAIKKINCEREKTVLILLYLDGKTFEEISDIICYSYRQTRRIIKKAEEKLMCILSETMKELF